MSIERKITYIFSSDPANGASNIQQNGSVFNVTMQYPISLPKGTQYATMEVHSASIWYVTPNISAARNNNYLEVNIGLNVYPLTISDGLYNFPQLVNALAIAFNSNYSVAAYRWADMFSFDADNATQRVAITVLKNDAQINWNVPNSVRDVFGFVAIPVPPALPINLTPPAIPIVAPITYLGNAEAAFNTINQYYISGNLVHTGIPSNSISSNLMTVVYIDVPPGSQINYQPQLPLIIDASELIGGQKTSFTFRLTDQNFIPVDTFGEYWSFIVTIRFWI